MTPQSDPYVDSMCSHTAEKLTELLALRGISGSVVWENNQYVANGQKCGSSVHGVYAWMDANYPETKSQEKAK